MSATTDVLATLLELEAQVNEAGWDNGCGLWGLHAHEADLSDLVPMKLGGPDYADMNPVELIGRILPPPACHQGLAISFECWSSERDDTLPSEAVDRKDTRYVIGAVKWGAVIVVEHVRDQKPKAWLVDQMRLFTMQTATAEVAAALHNLVMMGAANDESGVLPGLPPGMPPELAAMIESLIRGEGPEGMGFIILGGGE